MNWSPLGSSVHGISQARILEWVAVSFSRGSSWPRNWSCISWVSYIGRWTLHYWDTRDFPFKLMIQFYCYPHCMDEHAEAQTGDIPFSRSWSSSYAVALGFTQVCILTTHLWGLPVLWRTFQCMLTSWHYLTHHADFSSTSQLVFSNQIIYRVLILCLVRRLQDRIKQPPH